MFLGKLRNKITGLDKMAMPEWIGEIHDAQCRFKDIAFDSAAGVLSIRC